MNRYLIRVFSQFPVIPLYGVTCIVALCALQMQSQYAQSAQRYVTPQSGCHEYGGEYQFIRESL